MRRYGSITRLILVGTVLVVAAACGDRGRDDLRTDVDRRLNLALAEEPEQAALQDFPQPVAPVQPERPAAAGQTASAPGAEAPTPEPEEPEAPEASPPESQTPPAPAAAPQPPPPEPPSEEPPEPPVEQPPAAPLEADLGPGALAESGSATEEGPATESVTVPSGTSFQVRLLQQVTTRWSRPGDLFLTELTSPISDGERVLVPAGTTIRGRVTRVREPSRRGDAGSIDVQLEAISIDGSSYPIEATITELQTETVRRPGDGGGAGRVAGGALTGAILGRILGGNTKGALIGAAAGAGLGALRSGGGGGIEDVVLAVGSQISCVLAQPVTIQRQLLAAGSG
ncbi:MAG: hypothetical protein ACE5JR_12760 [Gemmatimonadota bacterium]